MLEIPSINGLGFAFGGAGKKQGIINAAAGETPRGRILNGSEVFLYGEGNESQPIANFFDEEHGLLGWNHGLNGQGGHDRVHFGKRMNAAGGMPLFRSREALEAGLMVNMTGPEGSDQNGKYRRTLSSADFIR